MQIFLQVLSVIGIILLCIIGLAFLIVGLVLFVPLRYKIKAQKDTEIVAQIQATWLLHLLSIKYRYPAPGEIEIRLLGSKVWKMKPGEASDEHTEKEEDAKEEAKEEIKEEMPPETKTEAKTAKISKTVKEQKTEMSGGTTKNEQEVPPDEKKNFFEKIQFKIKTIYDKIKKIVADYEYYRDLLQEKENKLLFERCKMRLFKIVKHVKPKILKADVLVGTGEPDTTGYLMAVYGMFIPVLGNHINITPDFDRKVLEGRLYAKGRITVFNLLYNGAGIYFDDQLHLLIDKWKRKDA